MWKVVPNTDGAYSANSETGQIKSNDRLGSDGRVLKGVVLKTWSINSGYNVVSLRVNGKTKHHLVHRLMGETFLENYNPDLDINHINGNKRDNRLCNLECITRSENILHARRIGLITVTDRQRENARKLGQATAERTSKPIAKCNLETGDVIETFKSLMDAHRKCGYDPGFISRCASGKGNSAYGYSWKWVKSVTTRATAR